MTLLTDALATHQIDPAKAAKIRQFVTLFERWNQSINLSAARTRDAIEEHVVDSLATIPYLRESLAMESRPAGSPAVRALDVGSGGGFPVVIAAIVLPDVHFVALEPVHKKHAFLRTAARELGLSNLEPLAQRIEDHADSAYDVAMSRATFDLNEWLARARAKVRPGGTILGFEAIPMELPADAERLPYAFLDKTRAIVRLKL